MEKQSRCGLCEGQGKLWLGGKDYLECPDCGGKGVVTYDETRVRHKDRLISIPGLKPVRQLTNEIVKVSF